MLILAIDTTASTSSCALARDNELIASFRINKTLTHSETLLPMIKNMCELSSVRPDDIELYTCSAGPGSFTGVRIGVATIKGMAFGRGRPCIGVSALEALAENFRNTDSGAVICPVMDARRDTLYNALFLNGERLCEDRCIPASELCEELKNNYGDRKIIFAGDGCTVAERVIQLGNVSSAPENLRWPDAFSVAQTALRVFVNNPECDYSDILLSPVYLRPSQAERTREFG